MASPPITHRCAAEYLGNASARTRGSVVRQRIEGEESRRRYLVVGLKRTGLLEILNNENRHMIATRNPLIEKDSVQPWRAGETDIALLRQFPHQRLQHGLADLHPAARQVPAAHIAVLYQQDAAGAVDHQTAYAECHPARKAPIKMKYPAEEGFPWRGGNIVRRFGLFHRPPYITPSLFRRFPI